MPKILRIINRFNLGGPTYNAAYLTKYLAPEFETLLVGGFKDESEEKSEFIVRNLGIEPLIISEMRRSINPVNDIYAYRKLSKIIKEFKPDIVHTHASKAGTLGRLAAYNNKVPVIIHTFHGHVFHSYFSDWKSQVFQKIERKLAKLTTKIIAISDLQKQELSDRFRIAESNKICVIPLGFDLSRFRDQMSEKRQKFREEYNLDDNEIAIGIIGRIVPIKNHEFFLHVIKRVLKTTTKKIRFFIVGDGELRSQIESLAIDLGLPFIDGEKERTKSVITFTSWIKEVDWVYAGLDIVALTSLNEGTPVSLIEAQASGKPIVTTNAGGIENTVKSGSTAFVTEQGNIDAFALKLEELVESESLRIEMSKNGWEYVSEKYHYTRLVKEMSRLYNELLSKKIM